MAAVLIESPRPVALARFYRNRLGLLLQKVPLPGRKVHYACELGGVYLAISRGQHRGSSTCLALMVEDVERAHRALRRAKVPFDEPPRRGPLGLIARLRDPDGNPVELYQP